ncbi:pyridoxamine 5'-phosphate oxidase family protein [Halobacterium litoreum]|uniref:Pyridoxamine 5'-phosphate oxidase family protein n=1 Tax=Halobacterium litoreum TaxID=2039234 RepID=A0ABD5NDA9_9EURY|nr:pyridoxamine 5'-phosphate oxidase family protein [Halobacterium litoreum]UHH14048.1 pyridoxamine 5'-phosphate oxidase family protein [Halobacterium litoreum]
MEDTRSVHMDDEERNAFLGSGGTGVISFGTSGGDPPHSVPVSYGYDGESGDFYFRLAYDVDSEKPDPVDGPVTFVTHRETDDGWRSVVAHGSLEPTDENGISTEALSGLQRVDIPLVDVFEREPRELSFRFFRLRPDDVDGRKESRS